MPFRIDNQFRQLDFDLRDGSLEDRIGALFKETSDPHERRGLYNMLRTASMLEGSRFVVNDMEALNFLSAWSQHDRDISNPLFSRLNAAYVSGKRANRVFNQVSALKKHWDYSVPIGARFLDRKNVRVYYKIAPAGSPSADSPIIEDITDNFGRSRVDFFPPKTGRYDIFASTKRKDLEGMIDFKSPDLAIGKLDVLADAPTIAIDIVGLFHHYGLETSAGFLKALREAGYQIIGITPYDDLHAKDRIEALLDEGGLSFVDVVHNSFRLSDYYETDRGRQEFLAEYVKQMHAVLGVPVSAAIVFSRVAENGFRLSGFLEERDMLAPEGVSEYGKEAFVLAKGSLSPLLQYLQDHKNIDRYREKIQTDVRQRDSDDYRERMSWFLNRALRTKFSDGNDFSYVRDIGPKRDHSHASFEAYCDHIERTGASGTIVFETYAWHSDEEGLTIAMIMADKAYRARDEWDRALTERIAALSKLAADEGNDNLANELGGILKEFSSSSKIESDNNPNWKELTIAYRRLITELTEKPGDSLLQEKREGLFDEVKKRLRHQRSLDADVQKMVSDRLKNLERQECKLSAELKTGLRKISSFASEIPRVPIYCLVDKTAMFQFAAPAGIHDGKMALEVLNKSGVWLTVVPQNYAYEDRNGVIDPLYHRREPFNQVIPCKHAKLAVFEIGSGDNKTEWVALGGGRFPGTKMMGSLGYRRRKEPGLLSDAMGQSSGNFEDDTYIMKGPIVADIYKLIMESTYRNRPISEAGDRRDFIPPAKKPQGKIMAGDNRMWLVHRFPWEGVAPAATILHMIWNNSNYGTEFTIVNGYNLDERWVGEFQHLFFAGSGGASQKKRKKINIYTGGMKFVDDMLDGPKCEKLARMLLWIREARQRTRESGLEPPDDQVNVYIIKAREFDRESGARVDAQKASNQQVHNRIFLLTGEKKENDIAFTGNQNVDVMSLKDKEDVEILWGPAVEKVKERVAELREKSIHLNAIPGIVRPGTDGSYMTEAEIFDFIFAHLNMNNEGLDEKSPTGQSFLGGFFRIVGTAVGAITPKFLDQPTSIGTDILYTPALIGKGGFNEYQRLDINLDLAKYYGMRMYYQLLVGAAYIPGMAEGINLGIGVDGVISPMREEWDRFSARWLGVDILGSVLFPSQGGGADGSLRIGATPLTMAFRAAWSRWELDWSPVQLGLQAHFGDNLGLPGASLFLGTQMNIRWRDLDPVRDGDIYRPFYEGN